MFPQLTQIAVPIRAMTLAKTYCGRFPYLWAKAETMGLIRVRTYSLRSHNGELYPNKPTVRSCHPESPAMSVKETSRTLASSNMDGASIGDGTEAKTMVLTKITRKMVSFFHIDQFWPRIRFSVRNPDEDRLPEDHLDHPRVAGPGQLHCSDLTVSTAPMDIVGMQSLCLCHA